MLQEVAIRTIVADLWAPNALPYVPARTQRSLVQAILI